MSANVAAVEANMGDACCRRARRAHDANDLDRAKANLEQALLHLREAARIHRAIGRFDDANRQAERAVDVERLLQQLAMTKVAAATRG